LGKLPAATERKLRLFAVACCRRVRGHFSDFHWQLVELSERFAEGETSQDELRELTALIAEAGFHSSGFDACMAASGMGKALWDDPAPAAYTPDDADLVAQWYASYVAGVTLDCEDPPDEYYVEEAAQAGLLHDIFGNPFRPVPFDPAWLARNDHTILKLARA